MMKIFYMVGNTHFDPVWLWTWDEAMASIRATFHAVLQRMEEDDDFRYSFAAPPVFEWIRQVEPELFEKICQRVREGRWELAEGWWLQPDCYGAMGECYVRQGLYGQHYLKEVFGMESKTVFNVDSFGHSPMLPQILSKSGIKYYCFCRPEQKHYPLSSPLFRWKSKDGSEVMAFRVGGEAGAVYAKNVEKAMDSAGKFSCDLMMVYGVTDHGGAPTKEAIAQIHARENAHFSTVEAYFKSQSQKVEEVEGELLTGDYGPYCNYSGIKRMNRKAEYALLNAEKACVIANQYYKAALTQCWKDVLFNQFHDILGGACIPQAYTDARDLYGRAIQTAQELLHKNLQMVTAHIQMPGRNPENPWNIVVWNLNGFEYDGYIEAEVQWAHEFDWYDGAIVLEDSNKVRYECQIIRERSVIPGFRSRFVFKAKIPPMGYRAFCVVQMGEEEKVADVKDPFRIDTGKFLIELSEENGSLVSVHEKEVGKVCAGPLLVPTCYEDNGDTWCFNIDTYGRRIGEFHVKDIKITENAGLRTTIKVTSVFHDSKLEVYYTFYKNEDFFDVRYRVNWNEKHMVLKLDINQSLREAAVSVPYGSVRRGIQKGDRPLGQWISVDGFSILADGIFAYDHCKSKLGLTILRSPIYGDLRREEICLKDDYEIMEQGITEGAIRIIFHRKELPEHTLEKTAAAFVNKPTVIVEANHGGSLPAEGSYFHLQAESAVLTVVKHCEEENGVIVRIAEYDGKDQKGILTAGKNDYPIIISPYEIKTLKLTPDQCMEVNMLEQAE